jgi:peptidoglycan/xylan/chitin deacetylase (PgdA/CDA1 family)
MRSPIPVLLYHRVAACDVPRHYKRFVLEPSLFEDHLRAIADAGCQPLLVSDLARALREPSAIPDRPVVITFDDGFADNLRAFEQLAAKSLSATLYVTTGWIGKPSMLTAADLKRLSDYPIEVGAHSVSHPRLDEIGDDKASAEIADSATQLEDMLGHRVRTFAYPHGCYDERTRQAVISAGYQSAAAVKNALSHPDDDPFALARWTITAQTPASQLAEVLRGGLIPKAWPNQRRRTRAYRRFRRLRRRLIQGLGAE